MMRHARGHYYVLDVVRGRWASHDRTRVIINTARLDIQEYGYVPTWIEQAPGLGKEATEDLIRQMAGFTVYADPVRKDKQTRAEPFRAQALAGNVFVLAADWNSEWFRELESFPNGKHDDQIDSASGAFLKLATRVTVEEDDDPLGWYRG